MSTLPPDAFPPDLEAYVQQEIAAGRFQSREEFALTAARTYREMDERRKQLKADIEAAIAEADAGLCEPLDIEELKKEILANMDDHGRRIK